MWFTDANKKTTNTTLILPKARLLLIADNSNKSRAPLTAIPANNRPTVATTMTAATTAKAESRVAPAEPVKPTASVDTKPAPTREQSVSPPAPAEADEVPSPLPFLRRPSHVKSKMPPKRHVLESDDDDEEASHDANYDEREALLARTLDAFDSPNAAIAAIVGSHDRYDQPTTAATMQTPIDNAPTRNVDSQTADTDQDSEETKIRRDATRKSLAAILPPTVEEGVEESPQNTSANDDARDGGASNTLDFCTEFNIDDDDDDDDGDAIFAQLQQLSLASPLPTCAAPPAANAATSPGNGTPVDHNAAMVQAQLAQLLDEDNGARAACDSDVDDCKEREKMSFLARLNDTSAPSTPVRTQHAHVHDQCAAQV
jgi:hypothetical protein